MAKRSLQEVRVVNPCRPEKTKGLFEVENKDNVVIPGLFDMHVHFREPGYEHKESIHTGSLAAFSGGVTLVQVMPNTSPVLDTAERVREQIALTEKCDGVVLYPSAAITKNLEGSELTNFKALKEAGAHAVTDDGHPVMDGALMREAFVLAREYDLLVMQHAEDYRLSNKAPMNLGEVSRKIGMKGQDPNAEGAMVERDIALAADMRARYHVLHISTERALNAVRRAKDRGLPVTCEVTPHHLILTDEACLASNPNTKMNPPLRVDSDRRAMLAGLKDGSIDAVASDHAPHSSEEKGCGFCSAPFGVVGLETAFPILMTLVHRGEISLLRAVELMTVGPKQILNLPIQDDLSNYVEVNPNLTWQVAEEHLKGKSKNSAFFGLELTGSIVSTFFNGKWR